MKQCPQCAAKFDDSMEFCPDCGRPLEFVAENNVNAPSNNGAYTPNFNTAPQSKYCQNCGNQCDPLAVVCPKCGVPFQNANVPAADDQPSTLLKIVCFFIPLVGLILYIVNKDKKPVSAKAYGKMAIIGVAVGIALNIVSGILQVLAL